MSESHTCNIWKFEPYEFNRMKYFLFKGTLILIDWINLLKGAFKKIRSMHCKASKFAVVTDAFPPPGAESRRNNSSITFFREVGHHLYVTEYKFGNTNARSSGTTISISSRRLHRTGDSSNRTLHGSRGPIFIGFLFLMCQKKERAVKFLAAFWNSPYFILISSYPISRKFQFNYRFLIILVCPNICSSDDVKLSRLHFQLLHYLLFIK